MTTSLPIQPELKLRMPSFVRNNALAIVSLLFTLVSVGMHVGVTANKLEHANTAISKMEASGSEFARTTRALVDHHSADIKSLKDDQKDQARDIGVIKSDVRIVAEWVQEQKMRDRGSRNSN